MRTWYFSEMAYHPAWEKGLARGSLRVNFPSENIDPEVAGKLLNRYLDEFALCDDVGIDIMVNEHHSTATCMTVSVPMALSIIARETKKSRLLSLGNPNANRPDPERLTISPTASWPLTRPPEASSTARFTGPATARWIAMGQGSSRRSSPPLR